VEIIKTLNKKLFLIDVLKLIIILLVPLQFSVNADSEGIQYITSSQSYLIWRAIGNPEYMRFRWIIAQYPISLALGLVALIFSMRLLQRQGKSYPFISAFVVGLALSIVPVYLFIQFFFGNSFDWFLVMMTAPVSIGYCSILLLIFVILPSIRWYSDSITADRSTPVREDNQEPEEEKRTILTPKMSSYLMFLTAFLLPGMMLWQSHISIDTSYQSFSFVGFLLQFGYGFDSILFQQGLWYALQDISSWNILGVSIICCVASLVFAWTIMRYVHGRGSKRTAILIGFISEIPPIAYVIGGHVYEQVWLILPFPVVLVLGLLVLRFANAIEPSKKRTELYQSEITVPLIFRMKSYLFRQHKKSDETPIKSSDAGDEEVQ